MKRPGYGTVYVVIPLGDLEELPQDMDALAVQEAVGPFISHLIDDPGLADSITTHLLERVGSEPA